ncbi:cryptochrome/photolyase family protein [Phaeocystidibacter luteus]|uniref:Deoxyribodipyrimidine photo-lyase n=1 Tax=Phaeocystidibacter luteus TaxID=911197 RepID=A0A6N6RLL7_9FLAO|nr:deoxyribodipyrimidine photo-lyase [Phaeocystidibacter luteus]KAB2814460.1 deoxyribodipyrimidine photo-lyase [Phaeocystidibacter luteus]
MSSVALFWHRRDLRIHDNAGLFKALSADTPVQPVFIFDSSILDKLEDKDDARVSFIYREIQRLKSEYEQLGASLLVKYGDPLKVYEELLQEFDVEAVFTNRDYEPYARERDKSIHQFLKKNDVDFIGAKDHVIFEKSEVVKDDGDPYLVYTPYSKKWKAALQSDSFRAYDTLDLAENLHQTKPFKLLELSDMDFVPSTIEIPARQFPEKIIDGYDETRDIPSIQGTSRLSVHLRFGTISIRALAKFAQEHNEKYLNELIWRDFYQMILFHHPDSPDTAIKSKYDNIEWEHNEEHYDAWCEGKTGYPLVDAGMRELNETGFMHNRVRMVVASFLTKHLLLDWRLGERYFARKLLDFELASNVGGWQWASGSGCDAAPYFRIFNPESQLEKYDKDLKYVKRWVPEYGTSSYPEPIVVHKEARERALDRYKSGLN